MDGDGRPLAGRTILAVFAHPDDESLACGGTLARASDAGARVVLLCASRGERGSVSRSGARARTATWAACARANSRDAAAVLGIAEVTILDHPDGDLRWAHVPALHAEIVMTIERCRPDAVITFGEDGLYWHLDHIGVHERTYTAVLSFGAGGAAAVLRDAAEGRRCAGSWKRRTPRAARRPTRASGASRPTRSATPRSRPTSSSTSATGPAASSRRSGAIARRWAGPTRSPGSTTRTRGGWLGFELFRRAPIASNGVAVLEQLADPVPSHCSSGFLCHATRYPRRSSGARSAADAWPSSPRCPTGATATRSSTASSAATAACIRSSPAFRCCISSRHARTAREQVEAGRPDLAERTMFGLTDEASAGRFDARDRVAGRDLPRGRRGAGARFRGRLLPLSLLRPDLSRRGGGRRGPWRASPSAPAAAPSTCAAGPAT